MHEAQDILKACQQNLRFDRFTGRCFTGCFFFLRLLLTDKLISELKGCDRVAVSGKLTFGMFTLKAADAEDDPASCKIEMLFLPKAQHGQRCVYFSPVLYTCMAMGLSARLCRNHLCILQWAMILEIMSGLKRVLPSSEHTASPVKHQLLLASKIGISHLVRNLQKTTNQIMYTRSKTEEMLHSRW